MVKLTIPITGMSCGGCVQSVHNALAGVPGVTQVDVKIGTATVTYDSSMTTADALRGAIAKAGYVPAAA
jgi:copper chaperone CopZ